MFLELILICDMSLFCFNIFKTNHGELRKVFYILLLNINIIFDLFSTVNLIIHFHNSLFKIY